MYKVSIVNQADVTFNRFRQAYDHLKGQMYVTDSPEKVQNMVDSGEVFRAMYGFYYGEMRKVA